MIYKIVVNQILLNVQSIKNGMELYAPVYKHMIGLMEYVKSVLPIHSLMVEVASMDKIIVLNLIKYGMVLNAYVVKDFI